MKTSDIGNATLIKLAGPKADLVKAVLKRFVGTPAKQVASNPWARSAGVAAPYTAMEYYAPWYPTNTQFNVGGRGEKNVPEMLLAAGLNTVAFRALPSTLKAKGAPFRKAMVGLGALGSTPLLAGAMESGPLIRSMSGSLGSVFGEPGFGYGFDPSTEKWVELNNLDEYRKLLREGFNMRPNLSNEDRENFFTNGVTIFEAPGDQLIGGRFSKIRPAKTGIAGMMSDLGSATKSIDSAASGMKDLSATLGGIGEGVKQTGDMAAKGLKDNAARLGITGGSALVGGSFGSLIGKDMDDAEGRKNRLRRFVLSLLGAGAGGVGGHFLSNRLLKTSSDSSYLGRLVAGVSAPQAIAANKHEILRRLDPDGSYARNHLLLNGDMLRQQQALAYDHLDDLIRRRMFGGGYAKNALLGAILGLGAGGFAGAVHGNGDLGPTVTGALIGGATGGLAGAGLHGISKYLSSKVTDEDIARMKSRMAPVGWGQLVPGRSFVDAALA